MAEAERVPPLRGRDSDWGAAIAFQSLDDTRLRDLVSALIFTSLKWHSLRRASRTAHATPDLEGLEVRDRGLPREWWAKIVRTNASGAGLERGVERLLAKKARVPGALLIVVPSDLSQSAVALCVDAARRRGVPHTVVWSRRELQGRLVKARPDLLFAYFGVAPESEESRGAASVRHRLEMKRRIHADLLASADDRTAASSRRYEKFKFAMIVVRLADDDTYPREVAGVGRPRGWYEVGTYDFYYGGLEVVLATQNVVVHPDGTWSVAADHAPLVKPADALVTAFRVGRIPYDVMIDWDADGDEYFSHPHLYCRAAAGGSPFAEEHYCAVEEPFRLQLRPELEKAWPQ